MQHFKVLQGIVCNFSLTDVKLKTFARMTTLVMSVVKIDHNKIMKFAQLGCHKISHNYARGLRATLPITSIKLNLHIIPR